MGAATGSGTGMEKATPNETGMEMEMGTVRPLE
jgi:hypothetical protein